MNVVFHVPSHDPEDYESALGNIENLIADETKDVDEIVLIVNGDGLDMVVSSSEYAARIRALIDRHVRIQACQNTLDSAGRDANSLVEGVEKVPSAMGELVRLQTEGYAYIRP